MSILKLLGILLILAAAVSICREYRSYCERRIAECRAFSAFVKHIAQSVERYLLPRSEICRDYRDELLSELGFLPLLDRGESFSSAFAKVRERTRLPSDIADALAELFSGFGRGYLSEQSDRLSSSEAELSRLVSEQTERSRQSAKVTATLVLASALGLVILLI